MLQTISQKLELLQTEYNVKILFACESGSRAWGFASPDSDYDVRFIYMHPKERYLGIDEYRDVIELPVNEILDINGWDLKKALKLFLKSNAPLYEWLQSPIRYALNESFYSGIIPMMNQYFTFKAGVHHYLSMALNVFENDLQNDEVKLKRYFYALRPILAAKWITDKREVPPMEFGKLRVLVNDHEWNREVDGLLAKKVISSEKMTIKKIPVLQDFFLNNLNHYQILAGSMIKNENSTEPLNRFFRKMIDEF